MRAENEYSNFRMAEHEYTYESSTGKTKILSKVSTMQVYELNAIYEKKIIYHRLYTIRSAQISFHPMPKKAGLKETCDHHCTILQKYYFKIINPRI